MFELKIIGFIFCVNLFYICFIKFLFLLFAAVKSQIASRFLKDLRQAIRKALLQQENDTSATKNQNLKK